MGEGRADGGTGHVRRDRPGRSQSHVLEAAVHQQFRALDQVREKVRVHHRHLVGQNLERDVVDVGIAGLGQIQIEVRTGNDARVAHELPLRCGRRRHAVRRHRRVGVNRFRESFRGQLFVDVGLRPHRCHPHQFVRGRPVGQAVQQIDRQQRIAAQGRGSDAEELHGRAVRETEAVAAEHAGGLIRKHPARVPGTFERVLLHRRSGREGDRLDLVGHHDALQVRRWVEGEEGQGQRDYGQGRKKTFHKMFGIWLAED